MCPTFIVMSVNFLPSPRLQELFSYIFFWKFYSHLFVHLGLWSNFSCCSTKYGSKFQFFVYGQLVVPVLFMEKTASNIFFWKYIYIIFNKFKQYRRVHSEKLVFFSPLPPVLLLLRCGHCDRAISHMCCRSAASAFLGREGKELCFLKIVGKVILFKKRLVHRSLLKTSQGPKQSVLVSYLHGHMHTHTAHCPLSVALFLTSLATLPSLWFSHIWSMFPPQGHCTR